MNIRKQRLLKWILFLFTCSISFTVIPGTSAYTYGFFGESALVSVNETESQTTIRSRIPNRKASKANQLTRFTLNLWFILVIAVLLIIVSVFELQLPPFETPITRKVRIDD